MYLKKLQLHNFRCFQNVEIELHKQLTVFVGVNGSGKTSVLEGAAVAVGTLLHAMDNVSGRKILKSDAYLKSYVMGSTDDVQLQFPVEISAECEIDDSKEVVAWKRSLNSESSNTTIRDAKDLIQISQSYQDRLRKGDQSLVLPLLAYYGTGRLWDYHRQKKNDIMKLNTRTKGYMDCLDGTANIKMMMSWFRNMTIKKYQAEEENESTVSALEVVYKAMESCFASVTGYENVKIRFNMSTNELDVYYTDLNGLRTRIPLSQLSDGYKGTISLIADIAYRMANLNPQLCDRTLTETGGVVLIDEIDLHLHPRWQQRVLSDLMDIFPKIQFIVTTHAPAVINSVRSENLLILKDNQVMEVNSQVYGKDIKSVLNEIMGVSERPEKVARLFAEFYECLKNNQLDRAESILNEIDMLRDFHDPEVAGCRVKLKLERIRGGKA